MSFGSVVSTVTDAASSVGSAVGTAAEQVGHAAEKTYSQSEGAIRKVGVQIEDLARRAVHTGREWTPNAVMQKLGREVPGLREPISYWNFNSGLLTVHGRDKLSPVYTPIVMAVASYYGGPIGGVLAAAILAADAKYRAGEAGNEQSSQESGDGGGSSGVLSSGGGVGNIGNESALSDILNPNKPLPSWLPLASLALSGVVFYLAVTKGK